MSSPPRCVSPAVAEDFEDAFVEFQDRDVESAAAEIVDGDGAFFAFVESIGEGGGSGLVDEAEDFESGDATGVARRLALGVVEVGRDGDDGFGDRGVENGFGVLFQLAQDEGRDFGRREGLFAAARSG